MKLGRKYKKTESLSTRSRQGPISIYNGDQEIAPNLKIQMPRTLKHLDRQLSKVKRFNTLLINTQQESMKITVDKLPKPDKPDSDTPWQPPPLKKTQSPNHFVFKNPFEYKSLRTMLAVPLNMTAQLTAEPSFIDSARQPGVKTTRTLGTAQSTTDRLLLSASRVTTASTTRYVENYNFVSYQKQEIPIIEPKSKRITPKIVGPARHLKVIKSKISTASEMSQSHAISMTKSLSTFPNQELLSKKSYIRGNKSDTKIIRPQTASWMPTYTSNQFEDSGIVDSDELEEIVTRTLRDRTHTDSHTNFELSIEKDPTTVLINDMKRFNQVTLTAENTQEQNPSETLNTIRSVRSVRSAKEVVPYERTLKESIRIGVDRNHLAEQYRAKFGNFLVNPYVDAAITFGTLDEDEQKEFINETIAKRNNTEGVIRGRRQALEKEQEEKPELRLPKTMTMIYRTERNIKSAKPGSYVKTEEGYSPPRLQIFTVSQKESEFLAVAPLVSERYLQRPNKNSPSPKREENIVDKRLKEVDFTNADMDKDVEQYKNLQLKMLALNKEEHLRHIEWIADNKKYKQKRLLDALLHFLLRMDKLKLTKEEVMSNKKIFSRQPYEKPNSYQLIKAVKAGDARTVKKLLETNRYLVFDYDHTYETALHWASKRGYTNIAEMLLKKGADVDAVDMCGRTPLYYALREGRLDMVRYLLYYKANPWSPAEYDYKMLTEDTTTRYYLGKARQLYIVLKMTKSKERALLWERESKAFFEPPPPEKKVVNKE